MAQEMDDGIKNIASRNLLQVKNSQIMLPSDVYSVTSMNDSGERVSLQRLVLYHKTAASISPI